MMSDSPQNHLFQIYLNLKGLFLKIILKGFRSPGAKQEHMRQL